MEIKSLIYSAYFPVILRACKSLVLPIDFINNWQNSGYSLTRVARLLSNNIILTLCCLVLLQSCVAVQTFPIAARAGDTITLAVGSPDGMTKANTTLTFTPTVDGVPTGAPIDISAGIRSIVKINPDETSGLALFSARNVDVLERDAKHGAWLSMIVLDLPDATVLPVGEGVIDVTTSASYSQFSPVIWPSIGIEILPGTGVSNQFSYEWGGSTQLGNLKNLESLIQVVARPDVSILPGAFAAAEIKLNIPMQKKTDGSYVDNSLIRVVHDESNATRSKQVQMFWSRIGDEITINFLSPSGTMSINEMRFSVVLYAKSTKRYVYEFVDPPGPTVSSVKVFDVNGDVTVGDAAAYSLSIE